jgi:hypothetical protein
MPGRADIQPKPTAREGNNLCTKAKCDLGQVDVVFYSFNKDIIENQVKGAYSDRISAETDLTTSYNTNKSKRCCYERIDLTYIEYRQLDFCLVSIFDQGATEILGKITQLENRDKEVLAAFNAASLAVMDLKKKASDLKDAACKLKYAIPDPCNSEQLKALREYIAVDKSVTPPLDDFETIAANLIQQSEDVCVKANQAFEFTVKVAGIHAYIRIDSLRPLGVSFANAVGMFKSDVATNLKAYGDEWKKAWDDYVMTRRDISTGACKTRTTSWIQDALCDVKGFVCSPDCEPSETAEERLTVICNNVEGCFPTDCPGATTTTTKMSGWGQPAGKVAQ